MNAGRRDLLRAGGASLGAALAAALGGCGSCGGGEPAPGSARARAPSPPTSGSAAAVTPAAGGTWSAVHWSADEVPPEGQSALLLAGADDAGTEAPLLVALHGRGEAGRGLEVGAAGWRDDYQLDRAHRRLLTGTVDAEAVGGFATDRRLGELRASLSAAPYRGLGVVTPYTPVPSDKSLEGAAGFARFVVESLLPVAESRLGRSAPRARCGIDGVSMGGRLALQVAITHPQRFASVGALQPALQVREASSVGTQLAVAREVSPFALRLVSSEDDPFLDAVRALSQRLDALKVPHTMVVTPGPHDYAWNRGPGAIEMLLHHERVLRGLPPP